jgi:hypothetical protein
MDFKPSISEKFLTKNYIYKLSKIAATFNPVPSHPNTHLHQKQLQLRHPYPPPDNTFTWGSGTKSIFSLRKAVR